MSFSKLFSLTLSLFALFSVAFSANSIPSFGLVTAQAARSNFPDRAFLLDLSRGTQVRNPNFTASIASVSNFPVLGATDTQGQVNGVTIFAGKAFFTHFHPRGTETINVIQGAVRVSFRFEGTNGRVVSNVVHPGQSTIIPQDAGTIAVDEPVVP